MAEQNASAQEKTEQATPKRLQDARRKGDIARSRELTTTGVMLSASATLLVMAGPLGTRLADSFAAGFSIERINIFDERMMAVSIAEQAVNAISILVPILVVTVLAALVFSTMLGGVAFSFSTLAPKAERLNVGKGFKRMFSARALVELGKSVAKVGLVVVIAMFWMKSIAGEVLRLGELAPDVALARSGRLALTTLLVVSVGLIVVAAIDVPWQMYEYAKKLRMTRQEVKDESKETDGRPEVRQRIRQMQQEVATRRMMEAVPYADVIITNPTHYAVALRYDNQRMAAPEVVAKGQDLVAAKIREIGGEHRVPLFSAPPLARSLFHSTRIGQPIPTGLYTAVAQVLAYIFQLKEARPGGQRIKPPVPEVDESLYVKKPSTMNHEDDQDG
ncbi:MAG: flagellar biosynthesis protein FlhB [Pseudomonadota bacterium]